MLKISVKLKRGHPNVDTKCYLLFVCSTFAVLQRVARGLSATADPCSWCVWLPLQTNKVDAQCDKLATELRWQRFASKMANFQLPHRHLTYPTCPRWGDSVCFFCRDFRRQKKTRPASADRTARRQFEAGLRGDVGLIDGYMESPFPTACLL